MNYLIIVAGGNGERMQLGYNKIFAKIGRKPIIYWTIHAFEQGSIIDKIIICAKEADLPKISKIIKKSGFQKVSHLFPANHSRQGSTAIVLERLKNFIQKDDLIGVHNGVNPFVSQKEISDVFAAAKKYQAALLAYKATDTVKISDQSGLVFNTPIRQNCWYAQTPQVAGFADLYRAFEKAKKDNFIGTDDTQLLERIGIKAKIVPCSYWNFKITFTKDLVVARKILTDFIRNNKDNQILQTRRDRTLFCPYTGNYILQTT